MPGIDYMERAANESQIKSHFARVSRFIKDLSVKRIKGNSLEHTVTQLARLNACYQHDKLPSGHNYGRTLTQSLKVQGAMADLNLVANQLSSKLIYENATLKEAFDEADKLVDESSPLYEMLEGCRGQQGAVLRDKIDTFLNNPRKLKTLKPDDNPNLNQVVSRIRQAFERYNREEAKVIKEHAFSLAQSATELHEETEHVYNNKFENFLALSQSTVHWEQPAKQWELMIDRKGPVSSQEEITFADLVANKNLAESLKEGTPLEQTLLLNCYQMTMLTSYLAGDIDYDTLKQVHDQNWDQLPQRVTFRNRNFKADKHMSAMEQLLHVDDPIKLVQEPQELDELTLTRGEIVSFDGTQHVAIATGNGDELISFWVPRNDYDLTLELERTSVHSFVDSNFPLSQSHEHSIKVVRPDWQPQIQLQESSVDKFQNMKSQLQQLHEKQEVDTGLSQESVEQPQPKR